MRLALTASVFVLISSGAALAQAVGVASAVDQSAVGRGPALAPRTLALGDKVIHEEKIETNSKGLLQILLADGTSFTVGPNSSMTIDSFVYDPGAGTAKVVATLGAGVFRFIGGRTSKTPDGATLNSPVGVLGISGGIADLDFSGKGKPFHIDMLFGNGITLTDHGAVLGHIVQSGYSIIIGANKGVTVSKTPAGWVAGFQHQVASLGGDRHGGAPKGAATTVAEVFKPTTTTAPQIVTQPSASTPGASTGVADASYQPPITVPNGGDIANGTPWSDIYASSLADSYATYLGTYAFNISTKNLPLQASVDFNGAFSLQYHFGSANGDGVLTLDVPDGSDGIPETVDVTPTNVGGKAGFAYSTNDPGAWILASDLTTKVYGTGSVTASGEFVSNTGVADGVLGTISGGAAFPTFPAFDGNTYENGSETLGGTFSGALDHTSPTP